MKLRQISCHSYSIFPHYFWHVFKSDWITKKVGSLLWESSDKTTKLLQLRIAALQPFWTLDIFWSSPLLYAAHILKEKSIAWLSSEARYKLQFERGQTLHLILCILLVVSLLSTPLGAGRGKLKLYYSCTSQLLFCPSKIYQHCNSRQCWSESWRSVMCRGTRLFISQQNGVSPLLWYEVPCTHEMRTLHLIREQVGCTVHVKKRERKKEKEGAQAAWVFFNHTWTFI